MTGETVVGEEAPPPPARLHLDLVAHAHRAEIHEDETLVVDFGAPASAKYDLGGWLTSFRTGVTENDRQVAVIRGLVGRLALPAPGDGPMTLQLRGQAARNRPLRVYVNDVEIGQATFSVDEFSTVDLRIPEGRLRPGENMLLFRASSTGPLAGLRDAAVALDWLRLAPDSVDPASAAPVSYPSSTPHPTLRIPQRHSLRYGLEVPASSRLRGIVEAGRISVRMLRDGAEPIVLGELEAGPVDLDLSAHAGELAALELRAEEDASFLRPAVMVVAEAPREAPRAKNALIYLIDTLRADKLRPYNPESRVQTPGLNRFAEHAAIFRRAQTQENWTKPSVATLLSSLMPWEHTAIRGESVVPGSVELLPELLQERGYYTGSFIANGYVSDRFGFDQGWDTYRNYIREGRRTPAQYVAADVLDWLDERPQEDPFFLYVHTIDPHVPYRPPDDILELYGQRAYRGPVNFGRDSTLLENIKAGRIRLDRRDREHLEALYDGEITYHDVHFNAIIDGLRRRNLLEDTVIVVTADHGEEFWDHGSVGHGHNVYQELLHIPMFVRLPGEAPAQVVDQPMGLVDVAPTVLEVLGEEIPEDMSGRSVLPVLRGDHQGAPREAVSGFMDGWRTIVTGRYKLIHRTAARVMLFDLEADPREQNDIAAAHPIAVRTLRGLLGLELLETGGATAVRARRRPTHQAEETTIDAETEAQLRALGYIH